jgi:hypothetical protein
MLIAMAACVALVLGTILIHYEVLRLASNHVHDLPIAPRLRIIPVVIAAFIGHTLEVWLYGFAYWGLAGHLGLGTIKGVDPLELHDYIYFSAVTYTSLGFGDLVPAGHLRLLAGVEGLNGLILIGWSASFTYLAMERYWPLHRTTPRKRRAHLPVLPASERAGLTRIKE